MRPAAVASSVAQRHASRCALGLEGLEHFQIPIGVFGKAVDAGRFEVALAIHHDGAAGTQWHANPFFAIGLEVGFASGVPTTVFFAEVVADIGDIEQFVGVQVGIVVGRQNDVRPCTGVGRYRRFGAHIFPALVVHPHLDAGFLGEPFDVGQVGVDVTLHKAAPTQYAQLGVFLGDIGPLRMGWTAEQHGRSSYRASGDAGGLDEVATGGFGHKASCGNESVKL